MEKFKKEIELLKSAGYKIFKETNDYICFGQSTTVIDSDLFVNKKCK